MKVAIVGGGVIGLTTALQLQHELRNIEITVFASDFDNTVSHVAAGIFRVGSSYSGPTEKITRSMKLSFCITKLLFRTVIHFANAFMHFNLQKFDTRLVRILR